MKIYKTALIGLGRMGAEPSSRLEGKIPNGWLPISHAESIKSNQKLKLIALCDNDPKKVDFFKDIYNVSKGYDDYNLLLENEKPEFLTIATRASVRPDIIKKAAENGVKLIYAEKPLCNSLNDLDSLILILEEKKIQLGYGVNRRYHEIYRKAKDIINEGLIGNLVEIVIENGYSNLLWSHPHSTDLILFFANSTKLKSIQGVCDIEINSISGDLIDSDPYVKHGYFEFENGIKAIISNVEGTNIKLAGTKGNLTIHGDGEFIEIYTGEGYFYNREVLKINEASSATQNVLNEMISTFETNSKAPIELEEIKVGMEMLFGLVQSSLEKGRIITPSEINRELIVTGRLGTNYA